MWEAREGVAATRVLGRVRQGLGLPCHTDRMMHHRPKLSDFIEEQLMKQEKRKPRETRALRGILYRVRVMLILDPSDLNACQILKYMGSIWKTHPEYRPEWAPEAEQLWPILAMADEKG